MDEIEARRTIQGLAAAGRIKTSFHALEDSLPDDDVYPEDIRNVLEQARELLPEDATGSKWKVIGPLINGEEYAVVVNLYPDHVYVITCHYPP